MKRRSETRQLAYLLLTLSTLAFGYFFLRLAYGLSAQWPFTQEIVVTALGTIATVVITALLLNQQTRVELQKEQSIKFIELKKEVYSAFIDFIEAILLKRTVNAEDRLKMQFFSHRLAIVASPEVLAQYNRFQKAFYQASHDTRLDANDSDAITQELAELSVLIRLDLIGELDADQQVSQSQISAQILTNHATDERYSDQEVPR